MELYQLRSFVTVAELGNLTRAAERLNTSQPAVSAQIKALEEECGIALFYRTPKGMELTSQGMALLENARQLLLASHDFASRAASLKNGISGKVRIGINNDSEILRLPAILDGLAGSHPQLAFDLVTAPSGEVLEGIARRELDAGFYEGPCGNPDIDSVCLGNIDLCVVGPKAWEAGALDWKRVARKPWVFVSPNCSYFRFMAEMCRVAGAPLEPRFQSDNNETALDLATSGIAFTIIPRAKLPTLRLAERLFVWPGFQESIPLSFGFPRSRAGDPVILALVKEVSIHWPEAAAAESLAA